jgi:hypothetical protein
VTCEPVRQTWSDSHGQAGGLFLGLFNVKASENKLNLLLVYLFTPVKAFDIFLIDKT